MMAEAPGGSISESVDPTAKPDVEGTPSGASLVEAVRAIIEKGASTDFDGACYYCLHSWDHYKKCPWNALTRAYRAYESRLR